MNPSEIPSIKDRIQAVMIDGILLFIFSFLAYKFFEGIENPNPEYKKIVFLLIFIVYDPLMTFLLGGTLGHYAMGLRVRQMQNPKKNINPLAALLRFVFKLPLSWISLVTVSGNKDGRAIHDLICGSKVIFKKK